jgi:hypothetical protein
MTDRRDFLKGAGIIGLTSLSNSLHAQTHNAATVSSTVSSNPAPQIDADAIVLENAEMRLVIGADATARSLLHKPTGQECLASGALVPMFNVTNYRPYDNELQLAYPAKITQFPADRVRRVGDKLMVSFTTVGYEGAIGLKITDSYIAFRLESLTYNGYTPVRPKRVDPVDEAVFVQLPVRSRKNFGEWLNVLWDEEVAVNLLATDVETQIDGQACSGYHLFQAGTVRDVQLEGVGAALIVTTPAQLLDRIARVEEDFDLPRGVESRRSKEYGYSYYQTRAMTPQDADRHIKFAKMGGFRTMLVYYNAFSTTTGHFPWKPEYPRKMTDLKESVAKISAADIVPGFHILYTMANIDDAYVSGRPDPRLNVLRSFTLAEDIDAGATVIPVEENPRLCTMEDGKRLVRIQNELIEYQRFTTKPPYRFEGCQRGTLGTQVGPHQMSTQVGLLDMYGGSSPSWSFVRFAQDTSLQVEVAERLQEFYNQAGFKFMYFDGAEQVSSPFWYTVPLATKLVWDRLQPAPIFAEGSCKSHFSWHMITRGNAFDTTKPEQMKAGIRAYPATEIQRVVKDFTSINFGWIAYWSPSKESIGTQPDMLEYATSVAAAWDCPISLEQGPHQDVLSALEAHPRTPDNMEVIRRWEDVRAQTWLTQAQKLSLRNLEQEHTLLIDENGKFLLLPYEQIENVAGTKDPGRAFLFERNGNIWAVYWHTSGEGFLELPLEARQMTLMRDLGKPLAVKGKGKLARLPLGERRYLEFHDLNRQQVIAAFQSAKIIST